MNIKQLCECLDSPTFKKIAATAVNHFVIDSRAIQPGDVFVAICGEQHDGHDFVEQARVRGAIVAIVDHCTPSDIVQIQVKDTREALGQIAALHREFFTQPVIAITGSCGKTTVKEMLANILKQVGPVIAAKSSFNNDLGVPLTLLSLKPAHQYAVIEMGANHPGEIAYLCEIAKPTVALINNVGPAHLQGFGDMQGVAAAKAEIFAGLEEGGTAIINQDDAFAPFWLKEIHKKKILRFSIQGKADCSAKLLHIDETGCCLIQLALPCGKIEVQLPLPGEHQVENALAAATAATAVGVSLPAIQQGLESLKPVSGRLQLKAGRAGAHIIDDTYNANPHSVSVALAYLANLPGKRIFILGDMGELGDAAIDYHRQMGQVAKDQGIDLLITCGELSQHAAKAFGKPAQHYENQAALIDALQAQLNPETVLLVKGSRAAAMECVVDALAEINYPEEEHHP